MLFQPTAEVIADSLNCITGDRLTTMVVKFHRFILPEFNTHRMFSKNASSSRAIPVNRLINNVIADNVYPLHWGKNQKGMQAERELDEHEIADAVFAWQTARDTAIHTARYLTDLGVHKQVVNRLLEPFSTVTMIVSATEWDNFFKQRKHKDAQPEIQALAFKMSAVYESSSPDVLKPGDWHIPFVNPLVDICGSLMPKLKIAAGRAARVSYLTHKGIRDISEDMRLHDDLLVADPKHLSPFEHQAITLPESTRVGNFTGFKQYRRFIELGEDVC